MAKGDKTHTALIAAGFSWTVETYTRTLYDSETVPVRIQITPESTKGPIPYRDCEWIAWIGPFNDPDRPWRCIGRFAFNDLIAFTR